MSGSVTDGFCIHSFASLGHLKATVTANEHKPEAGSVSSQNDSLNPWRIKDQKMI